MEEAILEELKRSLPNFPDEVLRDWLLQYAGHEGWPPARTLDAIPEGRWRDLLIGLPLSFWRSLTWANVERHISYYELSLKSQDVIRQMVKGAVCREDNLYTRSIPDLEKRFNNIVEYVRAHGFLPKPPVLLERQGDLETLDGNHRLAVYYYCYGYFTFEVDTELQLNTREIQRYWVGKPNNSFNTDASKAGAG